MESTIASILITQLSNFFGIFDASVNTFTTNQQPRAQKCPFNRSCLSVLER